MNNVASRNIDLLHLIQEALDTLHTLNLKRYDGVQGRLPNGFPDDWKRNFEEARGTLLARYSAEDVLELLRCYESYQRTGGALICPQYSEELMILARVKIAVKAWINDGEDAGLRKLLGVDGAFGRRQRQNNVYAGGERGKDLKKQRTPVRAVILDIAQELLLDNVIFDSKKAFGKEIKQLFSQAWKTKYPNNKIPDGVDTYRTMLNHVKSEPRLWELLSSKISRKIAKASTN